MKRRHKTDANQREIVAFMRGLGATVQDLAGVGGGVPDLLVGWRGQNILMEVKNRKGRNKLEKTQKQWHNDWRGQVVVVRTTDEALDVLQGVQ